MINPIFYVRNLGGRSQETGGNEWKRRGGLRFQLTNLRFHFAFSSFPSRPRENGRSFPSAVQFVSSGFRSFPRFRPIYAETRNEGCFWPISAFSNFGFLRSELS